MNREFSDCLEVIDFLLDRGALINDVMYQNRLKDYYQMRAFGFGAPLHIAVEQGKAGCGEATAEKGTEPLVRDARGEMAIQRAEDNGRSEVVELLRPLSTSSESNH